MLDQASGADQVFQPVDQHGLEEHDRVQRGLARVDVQRPRFLVEEGSVDEFGQSAVEVMGRPPLGKPKAGHLFIEKWLLALHLPSTNPGSATATVLP